MLHRFTSWWLRGPAAVCALAPAIAAQYTPDPAYQGVDYTGPSVVAHPGERFNLFLPSCDPPPGGYPVLIVIYNGGLNSTKLPELFGPLDGPMYQALDSGFAVVAASATISAIDPAIRGNGIFHPPGMAPPGWAGVPPYSDPTMPMAEKDAVMLVQHVRHNAAAMDLDGDRISIFGGSGGAVVGMWAALGPERGPLTFPGGSGQELESSRVDAAIFNEAAVWFPGYKQDVTHPSGNHFPDKSAPPPFDQPAPLLKDTVPKWEVHASPLKYEATALNASLPMYMTYEEPTVSTQYVPVGGSYVANVLVNPHSVWHGLAWKFRHPHTRLVLTGPDPVPFAFGIHDAEIFDRGVLANDALDWLEQSLGIDSPWQNLGGGKADASGLTPVLRGCGDLNPGSKAYLGLSLAPELSLVYLLASLAPLPPVNDGGPLPTPDVVLPLATNEVGVAQASFDPKDVPSGVPIWIQVWGTDGAATTFVASNTLRITP